MIEYLKWDSDFLGFNTGLLTVVESIDIEKEIQHACSIRNYKLIYLFADSNHIVSEKILHNINAKLVDRKVIYELNDLDISEGGFEQTSLYNQFKVSNDLLQLAYESGKYSRFKLDNKFSTEVFIKMYSLWIENSVNGQLADKIYVIENSNQIIGMITLQVRVDTLHIGLIAVDPKFHGIGYGKQLINRAVVSAIENGLKKIEVPTQYNNKHACRFYESCGFRRKSITNVYHIWI